MFYFIHNYFLCLNTMIRLDFLFLIYLIRLVKISGGYNLIPEHATVLAPPDQQSTGLFGWSIAFYRYSVVVGAPGQHGRGSVFSCSQDSRICSELPVSTRPQLGSYFGSMLTSNDLLMFTCAPLAFLSAYDGNRHNMGGACYKFNNGQFELLTHFNMTRGIGKWSGSRDWYSGSIYGYSGVVGVSSGSLVIGAPLMKDTVTAPTKEKYSGSIVKLTGKEIILPYPRLVNFALKESDLSNNVTYNYGGLSVGRGHFFEGWNDQYIIGAPLAGNLYGKVFVCGDCFGDSRNVIEGFPQRPKNLEVSGDSLGERFGSSVLGCDMSGDGMADLVVGAPLYSSGGQQFSTGRIYVFIKKTTLVPADPPTLEPENKRKGSRFGHSLACLGDMDGDGYADVAVGSPYYGDGAVFIYRGSRVGLVDTPQIILAEHVEGRPRGFGVSVSSGNGLYTSRFGLGVGAHQSSQAFLIPVRPVARWQPNSRISFLIHNIIPERNVSDIQLFFHVKLKDVPNVPISLTANLIFNLDRRLRPVENRVLRLEKGQKDVRGQTLRLELMPGSLDISNMFRSPEPVTVSANVEWDLEEDLNCQTQVPEINCPMLDPMDVNKRKEVLEQISIPIKTGCSQDGCKCHLDIIDATVELPVVVGEGELFKFKLFSLQNVGAEPAFETMVNFSLSLNTISIRELSNCFSNSIDSFTCRTIRGKEESSFDLSLDVSKVNTEAEHLDIEVVVKSECSKRQTEQINHKLRIIIEHKWDIAVKSLGDKTVTISNVLEKEDIHEFEEVFEFENIGPSKSTMVSVQVFIPEVNGVINIKEIIGTKCETTEELVDENENVCEEDLDCYHLYSCQFDSLEKHEKRSVIFKMIFDKLKGKKTFNANFIIKTINSGDHIEVFKMGIIFDVVNATMLHRIMNYWYLIFGVIFGTIIIIVVSIFLHKAGVFNTVRIYRDEVEEVRESIRASQATKPRDPIQIDGFENIALSMEDLELEKNLEDNKNAATNKEEVANVPMRIID